MFFSVIIPTHKRKKLLHDLLISLSGQELSHNQFEVIVIATEGDEAYSLDFNSYELNLKITSIPFDSTGGKSASAKRNYGASQAQFEWLAFIDDDCVASPYWLAEAFRCIDKNKVEFVEGGVHIPPPERPTFTYKGIQRLSRPGGFQTCNMFYKKTDFLDLGGFDPDLPFYLEDTDLAWTFKESGRKSVHCEKAQVSHPVPAAAPHKMLESAKRMEKLPYLLKKHPQSFHASNMRALPRPYLVLAAFDIALLISLMFLSVFTLWILAVRLLLTKILLIRMLRGCSSESKEILQMYYYLLICPFISLIYLAKGNLKHKQWLFFR